MEAPGVHFYGFRQVAESPVFYALADAFVLPSLWEEWGLVVNEAMASGLPVVVSETAGCAEDLLRAGRPCLPDPLTIKPPGHWPRMDHFIRQNGFVFDPGSVASLANALLTLELNPTVRTVMGQHSREVVDQFSCQNFAQNALLAAHAALDGEVVPGKATTTVSADADCR
jgi:glycosyltransferase involved in cell wall biosynthesis